MFVSRVDTEVDKRIEAKAGPLMELRGTIAVASAKLAYANIQITQGARWRALAAKGARPQRLLWASTGTKNPNKNSDVLYIDSLVASNTISTVPPETLKLVEDHGKTTPVLVGDFVTAARRTLDALARGIDYADVDRVLEAEAIEK